MGNVCVLPSATVDVIICEGKAQLDNCLLRFGTNWENKDVSFVHKVCRHQILPVFTIDFFTKIRS